MASPLYSRYFNYLIDSAGNAITGVSVSVRRQGATCEGAQTGTVITVDAPGGILAGDTIVRYDSAGGTETALGTVAGGGVTATTITFTASVSVSDRDRLSPSNSLQTIYNDEIGDDVKSQPFTTSATGLYAFWNDGSPCDILLSGGGFGPLLIIDAQPLGGRFTSNAFDGGSTVAYRFNTNRTLSTTAKLLSIANAGSEKLALRNDGALTIQQMLTIAAGGITSTGPSVLTGAVSGVTTLTMSGAFSGATTGNFSNDLTIRRFLPTSGTALVTGDFTDSGWGSGKTFSVTAGSHDQAGQFAVLCGTGPSANPTVTLTYKDGAWPTQAYFFTSRVIDMASGLYDDQPSLQWGVGNDTGTTVKFTFPGTPVAGDSYVCRWFVVGR